ncbi:MAG: sulfite exporter TauE/SafE family protein [Myxococcales bacterium]|nr:sulfite exporter TauE/SafE family protein [Myxococcales bacterium]
MSESVLQSATFWFVAAGAALVAGFGASGHCALMCGPLACGGPTLDRASRVRAAVAWNAGRLLGYGLVGALLGALGRGAAGFVSARIAPVLPWLMAVGLVVAAFDLGRRVRLPAFLAQAAHVVHRSGARFSPLVRRLIAGAATPLLPCGVLWGGYLAALGAGSFAGGFVMMVAFALGGVPALAAVQAQAGWLSRWPRAEAWGRKVVPLFAAGFLVWRALHAGGPPGASCH